MYVLFIILTLIVAVLLVCIVLVQKSKGGGLSSQFGGGNQVLGVRGTNSFLEKTTWTLAGLILVLSVCCAYTMPSSDRLATRAKSSDYKSAPAQQTNSYDAGAAPEAGAPAAQNDAPAQN